MSQATGRLTCVPHGKLHADDAVEDGRFGRALAANDDTLFVGAPGDSELGDDAGAAYVFVRQAEQWTQHSKLTASDGAAHYDFGRAVAVDGDTAVIGGSYGAYVFVRNGTDWVEQDQLVSPAPENGLGWAVAVDGDTAVVGSPLEEDVTIEEGAAYVFVRSATAWSLQATLETFPTAPEERLGAALALQGDTLLLGAPLSQQWRGAVYVWTRSGATWSQGANLVDSGTVGPESRFGGSVAMLGEVAVIYGSGSAFGQPSHVYVFSRAGASWTEEQVMPASDEGTGTSIALSVDTLLLGAPYADDNGDASGAAYLYEPNGSQWAEQQKLTASDGALGDWLGISVARVGDTVAIGASSDNDVGAGSGTVYLFDIKKSVGEPCVEDDDCAVGSCVDDVCCDQNCGAGGGGTGATGGGGTGGGQGATGGATGDTVDPNGDDGGCGCRHTGATAARPPLPCWGLIAGVLLLWRRRRPSLEPTP